VIQNPDSDASDAFAVGYVPGSREALMAQEMISAGRNDHCPAPADADATVAAGPGAPPAPAPSDASAGGTADGNGVTPPLRPAAPALDETDAPRGNAAPHQRE
jgi:hypothetical protein